MLLLSRVGLMLPEQTVKLCSLLVWQNRKKRMKQLRPNFSRVASMDRFQKWRAKRLTKKNTVLRMMTLIKCQPSNTTKLMKILLKCQKRKKKSMTLSS